MKKREEVGDVLLQVLMHVNIAEEKGEFTMDEVIDMLSKKLVTRHPGIFAVPDAQKQETYESNFIRWDNSKKKEKLELLKEYEEKYNAGIISEEVYKHYQNQLESNNSFATIPDSYTPVMKADKVFSKAKKLYGYDFEKGNYPDECEEAFKNVKKSLENVINAEKILTNSTKEFINKIIGCNADK